MLYTTKSFTETQKLGEVFAKEIFKSPKNKTAVVLGLSGNLGGGKTTFLQGFAKGLGIKEKILSPTFIIYRKSQIPNPNDQLNPKSQIPKFKYFYHFDCYRINKPEDILELGFQEIISKPENIVAIEWPEKIYPRTKRALAPLAQNKNGARYGVGVKKSLPPPTYIIDFKFIDKNKREINFKV